MNGCLEQMADEGHVHVYIAQLGLLATDFKKYSFTRATVRRQKHRREVVSFVFPVILERAFYVITCQTVEVAARLRDAAVQLRITNSFAPSALFAPAFYSTLYPKRL